MDLYVIVILIVLIAVAICGLFRYLRGKGFGEPTEDPENLKYWYGATGGRDPEKHEDHDHPAESHEHDVE